VSIDEVRQGSRMKGMKYRTDVDGADSEICRAVQCRQKAKERQEEMDDGR